MFIFFGPGNSLNLTKMELHTEDFKYMQLKEYPVGACKLSLSVLDLSNNSLTGLPAELGKLFKLRIISYSHLIHL